MSYTMGSYEYLVLASEQSIAHAVLPDIEAARALVRRARTSAWFRRSFPDIERISVREVVDEVDGWMRSSAGGDRHWLPTRYRINIHPRMLNDIVVRHELAHVVTPPYKPDRSRRRQHMPDRTQSHGPEFTAALSEMVRRFGTGANHDELLDAYRHFGVEVADLDKLIADRAISHQIEAEHRDWSQQIRQEQTAAVQDGDAPPIRPWLDIPWGWWLLSRRRHGTGNHFGRDALATLISRIEPCRARDIKAIEDATTPPQDMRHRRIAIAAAAAIGLDPIWMRTNLGLVRWTCGIELEELDQVAPDWTAGVRRLNAIVQARPPYWVVEGPR